MTKVPNPPADGKPLLSVEEILGQIRSKAAALVDADADVVRIVTEHLLAANPAHDAVEQVTEALVAFAEHRLAAEPV